MGPACAATAVQDSPNAFVLRFAGAKAFSFSEPCLPRAGLSNPLRTGNCFPAGKMKDYTERQMSVRFQSHVAPRKLSGLYRRLAIGGAPGLLTHCIAKMSCPMLVNVP